MAVRKNVLTDATSRQKYVQGALALKAQFTGVTTTSLGIPGPSRPVSTWDRFVAWHSAVMGIAHPRPIFPPWHRLMLRTLEQLMQQAFGGPELRPALLRLGRRRPALEERAAVVSFVE
jgi:tyrosinase